MSYMRNGNTYLTHKELREYSQKEKKQKIKRISQNNAILWKALEIAVSMIPKDKLKDHKYTENNIHWLMNKAREEMEVLTSDWAEDRAKEGKDNDT
jgi:hypothetical protein